MPEQRIDVFISSTSRDLKKYRDKVKDTVLNAGAFPIAMEEFDATERSALQKCYDEVAKAEIFVGIYAYRYGFAPGADMTFMTDEGDTRPGDGVTGITEWEYRWALERKLPMLLYVVSDTDDEGEPLPWVQSYIDGEPNRSRLAAFKEIIMGTHVVGFFQSPDDLARQIAGALPKLLTRFESDADVVLPVGRRDFYRHVNLPANFVPRFDLLAEIRAALLLRDDGLALHGMGGIGKSVMARALCDDASVQEAFPDGILWVSLGQDAREEDLKGRMRAWVETLGGVVGDAAPSIERLKEALGALLAERSCLLIIDDVWRRRDADHFRVGGANCRLLVTTRDAEVGHSLGIPVQTIPLMTYAEAAALLDQWSNGALASASESIKRQIITDKLGRLPLAIRLAGAQLRGRSPVEWLRAFDVRRLAARRPESLHDSLALTFGLSFDALVSEDRALYAALAIFKEDEPIHENAIRRLWSALGGLDKFASTELIDDLAARALLEVGESAPREIILHDLLRDFVRAELTDPVLAHRALLEAYRENRRVDGWHSIPDDGYLYNHLIYHLASIGDYEPIRVLFLDDRWLNARVAAAGYIYDGYASDLETAWFNFAEPLIQEQIDSGDTSFSGYNDVARYALIRTTINSLASNHVSDLVVRAVEIGLEGWTPARALSIAQHVANPSNRALFYARLLTIGQLSVEQFNSALHQGLDAARSVREPAIRIGRLSKFLPFLEGEERQFIVAEAISTLETTQENRIYALTRLIPMLRPEEGRDALLESSFNESLAVQHDRRSRAEAMTALAPLLNHAQQGRLLELLKRFNDERFGNERYATEILEALIPYLQGEQLDEAKAVISAFGFAGFRARATVAVARHLPQGDATRAEWIDRARAELDADLDWIIAITALAAFSEVVGERERGDVLGRAFDLVERVNNHRSQVRMLTTLGKVLRVEDSYWVSHVLSQAKRLYVDDDLQADLLISLAGKLNPTDLDYVLSIGSVALEDRAARARLLEAYAPVLDRETLAHALRITYQVKDERAQVESIASLARALRGEERESAFVRVLNLAESIRDERNRGRAVASLVASLDGDMLYRALEIARDAAEPTASLKIVTALTERLTDDLAPVALEIARGNTDAGSQIEGLAQLVHLLSPVERRELEQRAIAGGERTLRSVAYLALYDAQVAETSDAREAHLARAVQTARRIPSPVLRAWAMAKIASAFDNKLVRAAVDATFEECLLVKHQWTRGAALAALNVVVTSEQRDRALNVISRLKDPWSHVWALAAYANQRDREPSPALVQELRRFLVTYLRNRTDVKRDSKLQFLTARAIYRAPTFDQATLAELARTVMAICWDWRWL